MEPELGYPCSRPLLKKGAYNRAQKSTPHHTRHAFEIHCDTGSFPFRHQKWRIGSGVKRSRFLVPVYKPPPPTSRFLLHFSLFIFCKSLNLRHGFTIRRTLWYWYAFTWYRIRARTPITYTFHRVKLFFIFFIFIQCRRSQQESDSQVKAIHWHHSQKGFLPTATSKSICHLFLICHHLTTLILLLFVHNIPLVFPFYTHTSLCLLFTP